MGNGVSCGASCISTSTRPPTAKLVDSDGKTLHRVQLPASVAELMIQFPGNVVSRAEDLIMTRRVKGMRADEQLCAGEVYLLFRRRRVGSRADDLLVAVARGLVSGGRLKKRVSPAKEEEDTGCSGKLVGGHRQRQWRPLLDTIIECN